VWLGSCVTQVLCGSGLVWLRSCVAQVLHDLILYHLFLAKLRNSTNDNIPPSTERNIASDFHGDSSFGRFTLGVLI